MPTEILAFTPEAFAHLGAHVKPEWFFEALAAGPGDEEAGRSLIFSPLFR